MQEIWDLPRDFQFRKSINRCKSISKKLKLLKQYLDSKILDLGMHETLCPRCTMFRCPTKCYYRRAMLDDIWQFKVSLELAQKQASILSL